MLIVQCLLQEATLASQEGQLISPGQSNLISAIIFSHMLMNAMLKNLARDSNCCVSEAAKLARQPWKKVISLKTEQLMARYQRCVPISKSDSLQASVCVP